MSRQRVPVTTTCVACGALTARNGYTYCSNVCQHAYQYKKFIERWKNGEVLGLQRLGIVSPHIKKYLRKKYGNKCCLCSWAKINPVTGKVPLVADHIDGDWQNNCEENLRLICPNCDALSPTYAALNKGRGRKNRPASKRYEKARSLK